MVTRTAETVQMPTQLSACRHLDRSFFVPLAIKPWKPLCQRQGRGLESCMQSVKRRSDLSDRRIVNGEAKDRKVRPRPMPL